MWSIVVSGFLSHACFGIFYWLSVIAAPSPKLNKAVDVIFVLPTSIVQKDFVKERILSYSFYTFQGTSIFVYM